MQTQNLKQVDEGVFAMVTILGGELSDDLEQKMAVVQSAAALEHPIITDAIKGAGFTVTGINQA